MFKYIYNKYKTHKNTPLIKLLKRVLRKIAEDKPDENKYLPVLKDEFSDLQFGSYGMQKLITDYEFFTVLDIGSGAGHHSDIFIQNNKDVTAIDYGDSIYFKENKSKLSTIIADFNNCNIEKKFDAIWCSHVLEHQLNVNSFLDKIFQLLEDDGILAITVPPGESLVIGGHLTNWNPGILLYNLVMAGFDCSEASVLKYGYNITVIIKKSKKASVDLSKISFDNGDLRKIKQYLPKVNYKSNEKDDPFDGNIYSLNW